MCAHHSHYLAQSSYLTQHHYMYCNAAVSSNFMLTAHSWSSDCCWLWVLEVVVLNQLHDRVQNMPTFVQQILWPCPDKVAYWRREDDLVKSLLPTIHSLHYQIGHLLTPPYSTSSPSPSLMPSDVDECVTGTHHCQQHCVNTRGSYKCACEGGYVLSSSGLFCIGQLEQHALTYVQYTLHNTV